MTTLEKKILFFKLYRAHRFKAFDIWEKAVLRGRETDDATVMTWYQDMKNFPSLITENSTREDYPPTPDAVKKYL